MRSYYEKKYGFKPPKPFHELIRKPSRDELPKRISERMQQMDQGRAFYDEEF